MKGNSFSESELGHQISSDTEKIKIYVCADASNFNFGVSKSFNKAQYTVHKKTFNFGMCLIFIVLLETVNGFVLIGLVLEI